MAVIVASVSARVQRTSMVQPSQDRKGYQGAIVSVDSVVRLSPRASTPALAICSWKSHKRQPTRRGHFCGWTSVLLLLPALELLLVPQGFDGIEIGGLSRRVIAKADPDQSGEKYREQYGSGADGRRPSRQA